MGAQWKNANKAANSAVKGALIHKVTKEIQVAAKLGGAEISHNARLRAAVEVAKKISVSKDTIERAIRKGAGLDKDGVDYETVLFEGFAPHQVALIVECLTDNKNRTSSSIKSKFTKGGTLGSPGSVGWMFDRLGVIEAKSPGTEADPESDAIEAGAQDVKMVMTEASEDETSVPAAQFLTEPQDLDHVSKSLAAKGWQILSSELSYIAKDKVPLTDAQRGEVEEFLNRIDGDDDVHRIYVAL
ncbi:MAG: hypothetical protein COT74_03110 [Bdellovibrionales bacterium CG10_big_fil_rev_8_21_14_0_10_45_34]|nr:MAG: hypothetical protein COT74_03110 [Bdellovibrionales bacterium CG10_big_fil_rev_8_21_14_0_10_45_34]